MEKRPPLGRGLGALLSDEEIYEAGSPGYFLCPLDRLRPNPIQPRKEFNTGDIMQLAQSIREKGVLQPLVVRRVNDANGHYEIIAGERRYRAALEAGLDSIPVVIKDVSSEEVLELALIENVQRKDLNPIEEAQAYKRLLEEYGLSQLELSKKVGKDRSTIANLLRLLNLPEEVQGLLVSGDITMGHARAILMLHPDSQAMIALADSVVSKALSVRQTECMARAICGGAAQKQKKKPGPQGDPNVLHISDELTHGLGMRVKVVPRRKGGKVEIFYKDLQELDRLIKVIERGSAGASSS